MAGGKWVRRRWEYPPQDLFEAAAKAVVACKWEVQDRDDAQRTLLFSGGRLGSAGAALAVAEEDGTAILSLKIVEETRWTRFFDVLATILGDSTPGGGPLVAPWRIGMPVTTALYLPDWRLSSTWVKSSEWSFGSRRGAAGARSATRSHRRWRARGR